MSAVKSVDRTHNSDDAYTHFSRVEPDMDGNIRPDGKGAGKIGIGGTKCKKQFCRVCICLSYDCFVLLCYKLW